MKWWEIILEIIKVTLPALIVFLTIYYLFKEFLNNQRQMFLIQNQKEARTEILPLRLQAYERLALFCERVKVPNLAYRLELTALTATDFRMAMLITIQQEFEHNVSQQVYVSKDLWAIVEIARNNTVAFINATFEGIAKETTAADFRLSLFNNLEKMGEQPMDTALLAIKREVSSLF